MPASQRLEVATMSLHDPETTPDIDLIASLSTAAVSFWLEEAEQMLNQRFGPGFAEKNPEIIAGILAACAQYFDAERRISAAAMIAKAIVSRGRL
jgi:hypothetical protein